MNKKLTMLYAFALVFACSPAFAEDNAGRGDEHSRQMNMEKQDSANPVKAQAIKIGRHAQTVKATLRKVTETETGKEAVCPVTGDAVKVTANTLSASYKGTVYYFCCPVCKKSFMKNPEKHAHKKEASLNKTYVCPMGDYQGDKPGKCPKCGMTLVEKK